MIDIFLAKKEKLKFKILKFKKVLKFKITLK